MCIACEQDAMWFAYLRSRGLIGPDGLPTGESPFADLVVGSRPAGEDASESAEAAAPAGKTGFSSDDPFADSAVDSAAGNVSRPGGKPG